MKKIYLILAILLPGGHLLWAQQARFIISGSVEFEKKVNTYALIKNGQLLLGKKVRGNEQQLLEEYQKSRSQFSVLKSTLHFSENKTLFIPADIEISTRGAFSIPMAAQNNTVFTDQSAGSRVIQKTVFGEVFLLTDSIRKMNWKITDEMREVAGYTCRRANALIMDSIYVVAFYAEKIHVSGGPESFSGLPGMILMLALPHEHIIWEATKVADSITLPGAVAPPKTGKRVDRRQLWNMLSDALKDRDAKTANLLMKVYLL